MKLKKIFSKSIYILITTVIVSFMVIQLFSLIKYLSPPLDTLIRGYFPTQTASTTVGLPINALENNNPMEPTKDTLVDTEVANLTPTELIIRKIQMKLPIVSSPLINGTWEVQDNAANFAEGTQLISNRGGNTGLFGHDRVAVFQNIKELAIDDEIEVITQEGYLATYLVVSGFSALPDNVNVFYDTAEPILTLVTCDGIFSQHRYIIQAQLKSINQIQTQQS